MSATGGGGVHAAQTSWHAGHRRPSEARALILQWQAPDGITVVRAMARHRWRHSQYVGLTRVQLEHSRRRADREHQRQAREQAERRSERQRMVQEHYFLGGRRVRDGERSVGVA